ncbi:MAG: formylmethanofuran dehydrogenase, partial [Rubrivivax sp.]
ATASPADSSTAIPTAIPTVTATPTARPAASAIAERLLAARYAVIVYETRNLGAHGALVIEMLQRVVAMLNRSTRAAVLALGGGEGAATVNAVFTWLSGLPLRSRAGLHGIEHEPLLYGTERLLADGAVDLLLWIASYGTEAAPPAAAARLPRIVLGHPTWAAADLDVYIPVATPGIGNDGHLFRTDGAVLMPLHALREETLPSVADVLRAITAALPVERAA